MPNDPKVELFSQVNVVELAREYGPSVLDFLKDVMRGNQTALKMKKEVPIRERLMAAEVLRKFAALPTNVQMDLGIKEKLVYIGDLNVVTEGDRGSPAVLRSEMEAEFSSAGSPSGSTEGDPVRRNRRRKPVGKVDLAD